MGDTKPYRKPVGFRVFVSLGVLTVEGVGLVGFSYWSRNTESRIGLYTVPRLSTDCAILCVSTWKESELLSPA